VVVRAEDEVVGSTWAGIRCQKEFGDIEKGKLALRVELVDFVRRFSS
jgi:hypothetical protein